MRRVIVAYDGSPLALNAIATAADLVGTAEVIVVHAAAVTPFTPPVVGLTTAPVATPGDHATAEAIDEEARRVAREGAEACIAAGFRARSRVALAPGGGSVAEAIVKAADDEDASLIVMGSHGHSTLRSALLGSVSAGVLSHTSRPVLIVPAAD